MRIDRVLHWLCLYKSRSSAARACRSGRVLVNDERVRPSREVQTGNRIALMNPGGTQMRILGLLEIPARQASRQDASRYYEVLATRKIDILDDTPGVPDAGE